MIKTLPSLLALAGLASAQIPLPPYWTSEEFQAHGLWFTAPVDCVLTGIAVPNELYQFYQAVEVLDFLGTPPATNTWNTSYQQLFYDNATERGRIVKTNLRLSAGQMIGVLGSCSSRRAGGRAFSSVSSYSVPFASNLLGNSVTLRQLSSYMSMVAGGNVPVGSFTSGPLGRIELYFEPEQGLYASFHADVQTGTSPLTVSFVDRSSTTDPGGITSWAWDFDGDGTVDSTQQNPTHVFASCGEFEVTLTVTDSLHAPDTMVRPGLIRTDYSPIQPWFYYGPIAGGAYQFTDASSPTPAGWAWDFESDGVIDSTLQNPVWTPTAPCTSLVTLTVTDGCHEWSRRRGLIESPRQFQAGSSTSNGSLGGNGAGLAFEIDVTNPSGINLCGLTLVPYFRTTNVPEGWSCEVFVTETQGHTPAGTWLNQEVWRHVGTGWAAGGSPGQQIPFGFERPIYLPPGRLSMVVHHMTGGIYWGAQNGPSVFSGPDFTVTGGLLMLRPFLHAYAGYPPAVTFHYSVAGDGDVAGHGFFGSGCGGSAGGITTLRPTSVPAPRLGAIFELELDRLPIDAAVVLTGFSRTSWGLGPLPFDGGSIGAPGCLLRVSPDAVEYLQGAGGQATCRLVVPIDPGLLGVTLFQQAAVLDPGFNAAGLVISDAYGMMIGL